MEILEKVLNYKYHIVVTLVMSSTLVFLVFVAPSFLSVLAYFWPLLLSTALFLVAVVFFGQASLLGGTDSSGDKAAGEGLLDYVAGQLDQPLESLDTPEQQQLMPSASH